MVGMNGWKLQVPLENQPVAAAAAAVAATTGNLFFPLASPSKATRRRCRLARVECSILPVAGGLGERTSLLAASKSQSSGFGRQLDSCSRPSRYGVPA